MSKPIADLSRNVEGLPVLGLYNLTNDNIEALRGALLANGSEVIHTLRADAGAHVAYWNPEERMVGVTLHGCGAAPWLFIHAICNGLGMSSGRIPNIITDVIAH